jgi:hypothetical protein
MLFISVFVECLRTSLKKGEIVYILKELRVALKRQHK